jgi:hypothetical protein
MSREAVKQDLKYVLNYLGYWCEEEYVQYSKQHTVLKVSNPRDIEQLEEVHITDKRITTSDFTWYSDNTAFNLCPESLVQYAHPFFKYLFDKKATHVRY